MSVVSVSLNSSYQTALVKILSLSEMMMEGRPCSLYTLAKKAWATDKTVYGWAKQIKWAYFVSLSMTTRIVKGPNMARGG